MSELDIEVIPEDELPADQTVHEAYFDLVPLEEKRRYLALDMARLCGPLPDKLVKLAQDIDKFLAGKMPKLRDASHE
jgi:hypothetical protein